MMITKLFKRTVRETSMTLALVFILLLLIGCPDQSGAVDTIPPGDVSGFTATPSDGQVLLTWVNPVDDDLTGVLIRRSEAGYPTGPADGYLVYNDTGTSKVDTNLHNGTQYYYTALAYDAVPNYSSAAQAMASPTAAGLASATSFELATWNIRILSDGSRDDSELAQIAPIIDRYDLVAIQEVRDTVVLDRLLAILPGWDYIASAEVGNIAKERYAYFYRASIFTPLGTDHVFNDANDDFIREPYIAHFNAGEFDFTLVTIHVIYGDTVEERRAEIRLLDDVLASVDSYNGAEDDVILLGDFNRPADDGAWQILTHDFVVDSSVKTTITDTSSYDNIWIDSVDTTEYQAFGEVYLFDEELFANDDDAASLAVSDHRPVSVTFSYSFDDDGPGDWTETNGSVTSDLRDSGDVRFHSVTASPTDAEQVTLISYSTWEVDISDWTIGDLNNPTSYGIPGGNVLAHGQTVQFVDTQLTFGINNSGEILYLKDGTGTTVDTWSN
jgi:endonuclease/exonuclease/phosphatase family metal-dependent hydrolase